MWPDFSASWLSKQLVCFVLKSGAIVAAHLRCDTPWVAKARRDPHQTRALAFLCFSFVLNRYLSCLQVQALTHELETLRAQVLILLRHLAEMLLLNLHRSIMP